MIKSLKIIAVLVSALFLFIGCGQEEIQKLRTENDSLKSKITSLEQEIKQLKETAEYHYRKGIELMSSENYAAAEKEFQSVIDNYPTSPVNSSAKQQLLKVKDILSKIEAQRIIEEKRLKAERLKKAAMEQKRLEERNRRKKYDNLVNYLKGDWKGNVYMIGVTYRWEPLMSLQLRITEEGKLKYTTSLSNTFRETIYSFGENIAFITKKDEFGDNPKQVELYPFQTTIAGYKYKYLIKTASGIILYVTIDNAKGKGTTGNTKIVLSKGS